MNGPLTIDDVFDAYFDCRRTKRNSINQLRFEENLETNLVELFRDLKSGKGRSFLVRSRKAAWTSAPTPLCGFGRI